VNVLDKLAHRLRGSDLIDEAHDATRRSEQILERVDGQAEEANRHSRFARFVMHENELGAKMRRALKEG
jgi:hypothetical protein